MRFCLIILVSLLVLICTSLALATTHPESEQGRRRTSRGLNGKQWSLSTTDPEKRFRECQKHCEKQQGDRTSLCQLGCQQMYEKEKGRQGEEPRRIQQEQNNGKEGNNPYVFAKEDFITTLSSEHGRFYVLPRFSGRSELLQGVDSYRLSIIEANPQTFLSPSHWSADTIFYVANGRGTITFINGNKNFINGDKRQSFNIEYGDVIRLRPNLHCYIINRDDNEKLHLISLLRPVNLPGQHRSFVAPNVVPRGSIYKAFSWELLEAALQSDRRTIENIFKQTQLGVMKASKQQIHAMTYHGWFGGGFWSTSGPFNLLKKRPVLSNNHGQLIEAKASEHMEHLHELDLMISFANIAPASMMGPFYNSRAIMIALVVDGEGHYEMVSPPDFSTGSNQTGLSYVRASSPLKPGMVFVVPAGYPVSVVASSNSNLEILGFEVNAHDNIRFPLAGRNNVVEQWERDAKELSFGVTAREVDGVFGNQKEEWFFPGPRKTGRPKTETEGTQYRV